MTLSTGFFLINIFVPVGCPSPKDKIPVTFMFYVVSCPCTPSPATDLLLSLVDI